MKTRFLTSCPYGEPRLEDCIWYHAFDFNLGVAGRGPEFDLRPRVDEFLIPRDLTGKRCLDVGTASGFFTFEMERRGGEVVSFDLSADEDTDRIPYPSEPAYREGTREFIQGFHKGYWYAHKQFRSKARAVYGTIMNMPERLGRYDVAVVASLLTHLRDPFGALMQVDRHVKDTLILSEPYFDCKEPAMRFRAEPEAERPQYWTWWVFSPSFLVNALKTLGYRDIETRGPFDLVHINNMEYRVPSFTVKGRKTASRRTI